MTLIRLSATETRAARDDVEAMLERAARLVVRDFVAEVRRATLAGLSLRPALVASVEPLPNEVPALGALAGRWAAGVDAGMLPAIRGAYAMAWRRWSTRGLTVDSPAMAALEPYVATVRDRLVRGTHFGVTVYEDSFEAVRRSLAQATSEGWTRPQLAQRIAAELSWETDGAYWRSVQKDVDYQIDGILDPLGQPGTPAREWARLNDPRVQALRDQRNVAIRHLDAERSVWQTRASLIARTEATGAYNYAAEEAFVVEGVKTKVWLATNDARTRITHSDADGQEVGVREAFLVGGAVMRRPGDSNAPAAEVANCRCTMIAGDYL